MEHRRLVSLIPLRRTIPSRVVHSAKFGPKPYITAQGGEEIADFLVTCSKIGYVKSRRVLKIVDVIAMRRVNGCISCGWWW